MIVELNKRLQLYAKTNGFVDKPSAVIFIGLFVLAQGDKLPKGKYKE